MTTLFQQAVAEIETLPEEEQNRAAQVLHALATEPCLHHLTPAQIAGVELAMLQADHGEFATDSEVQELFGRPL